jgi:23S rRNA G2069 N7-methylase RlmK/C1962 C5-methylase RlmI
MSLNSWSRIYRATAFTSIRPTNPIRNSVKSNYDTKFRCSSLLSSIKNEDDTATLNDDDLMNPSKYVKKYVVIRKNRQSMAFRNGSPLVFSGSVQKTVQFGGQTNPKEHKLEMGSLVGIVVSNDKDNSAKKNTRGKGRGTRATKVDYKHDLLDEKDDKVKTYSIDGDFLTSSTGAKDAMKEISNGKLIGFGFYNPVSMYRSFIFCHQTAHPKLFQSIKSILKEGKSEVETTENVLESTLRCKIMDAIRGRVQQGLPSSETDSYRMVNGEGDGLSGLAIDILGNQVAVIMASAAWCEIYKETIMEVVDDILQNDHPFYAERDSPLDVVWRNTPMRLKQDGYNIIPDVDGTNIETSSVDRDETAVVITENGIKYNTYPYDFTSQKTGFYLDQRNNRFNLAKYCLQKRVLDLCCYSGGFSLNAMMHGNAESCVGVDSSHVAVEAAEKNKELNDISSSLSFVKMDIAEYMKQSHENGNEYDVIALDPPKLAPTIAQLDRASRKYHSLNRDAMKLINKKEGGLLLTCTCSGAMTQKNGGQYFLETIQGAALSAGRRITLLSTSGAAPCHTQDPASFPANAYLTAALFSVSPEEE